MTKTIAHAMLGDCIVVAFGGTPSAREWDAYLQFLRRTLGHRQRSLVVAEGTLSNAQRREMEAAVGPHRERDRRVAIVVQSTLVRGFVMALSAFDPTFRAFSPRDLEAALRYVDVLPSAIPAGIQLIHELRREIGLPPWSIAQ